MQIVWIHGFPLSSQIFDAQKSIKAEHRMRTDALIAHGVPVLRWSDGAVTAAILRRLALGQRRQVAKAAR